THVAGAPVGDAGLLPGRGLRPLLEGAELLGRHVRLLDGGPGSSLDPAAVRAVAQLPALNSHAWPWVDLFGSRGDARPRRSSSSPRVPLRHAAPGTSTRTTGPASSRRTTTTSGARCRLTTSPGCRGS